MTPSAVARFHIDQDMELLLMYQEQFQIIYEDLEYLSVLLEHDPGNCDNFRKFRAAVEEVWVASLKINVVPLLESLDILRTTLSFIEKAGTYPPTFSEFSLILLDRLAEVVKEIKETASIDILKSQNIHVALQELVLSKTIDELTGRIPSAILMLIGNQNHNDSSGDMDIELFDDGVDLFDMTVGSDPAEINHSTIEEVMEWIAGHDADRACKIVADIADNATGHQQEHVTYMLPMALLINHAQDNRLDREDLYAAICFHDVGLGLLPRYIFGAKCLAESDWSLIKEHPLISAKVASAMGAGEIALKGVLEHHERVDGDGYPHGLQGHEISDIGKLMCLVDTFEAMTHSRAYRTQPRSALRAFSEINCQSGTQFDPQWIESFNDVMRKYWKLLVPNHGGIQ